MSLTLTLAQAQAYVTKAPTASTPTSVSAATNTNPVAITTSAPHLLATGDTVVIASMATLTSANGVRQVTVTGASTFTVAVAGNGVYSSGGTVTKVVIGQVLGDLKISQLYDLIDAIARVPYAQGNDNNRTAEPTVGTIVGALIAL
jgi:hypothetical protein